MLSQTLTKYCSLFNDEIDKNKLRMFLESSTGYPDLLSVLSTLKYMGLECRAGQCNWDYLKNLDSPVLIHVKSGNNQNLAIAKWDIKQDCLRILNLRNNKWETKGYEDTARYWDGVVIYTGNHQINQHFRAATAIILAIAICLLLLITFRTDLLDIAILYYLPLLAGFAVSCCLYFKSEMRDGGIIDRICHISKVTDCNRVEESKYSSVFGFKLDCLALSFFIGQASCVLISFLFEIEDALYSLYFISSVVSLPTIIYSIYGQLKVRNICPLCVIVALCIAIETVIFITWGFQTVNINMIALYCCIFLTSIAVLYYVSNLKNKEEVLFTDSVNFLKLKRKKEIIHTESTFMEPISSPVSFGNATSPTRLTTILSPSCSHCRKLVSECVALREKGLEFRWDIILGQTAQEDSGIIDNWIQRSLKDKEAFYEYLTLWCKESAQMPGFPYQESVKDTDASAIRQYFDRQIADLNINGFPKIIMNDRLLSSVYTSGDLEFLITDQINKTNDVIV